LGKVALTQPSEEEPARKDENTTDRMSVSNVQTGNSSCYPGDEGNKDHWKESDRKNGKTPDLHLSQRNLRKIQ
jgi:translation initiation factor 4B